MAQVVVMPQLGNTVESCLVTTWLVAIGDEVDANTLLCEIETDKSAMEVPAGLSGTVLALLAEEGDDVPVKQPIAVVGAPGESVADALAAAGFAGAAAAMAELAPPRTMAELDEASSVARTLRQAQGSEGASRTMAELDEASSVVPTLRQAQGSEGAAQGSEGAAQGSEASSLVPSLRQAQGSEGAAQGSEGASRTMAELDEASSLGSAVSPRARGLAASQGIAARQLAGTGPRGRVIERDVRAAIAAGPALTAGARAEATGFLPGAAGSGIGGRVTRADLAAGAPAVPEEVRELAVEPPRTTVPAEFPGAFTDTPLKGVRKVIAERMMNSLATSAQLTYTATAPAAGLLALRKRLKGAADPELSAVTVGDLVGYAAVRTLAKHAVVNAHLTGPSSGSGGGGVLRTFASVHLGMAVDTPRGLLVPTLRFADTLTLRAFSQQSKQLANAAIGGSISPDLLSGATFTVSNLGAFGIESFTPLLNVPQVAILGVDAIFPRATIAADGTVGAEMRIGFSLTADHRVIDGADAARYLKDLCAAVADIDLTLLG